MMKWYNPFSWFRQIEIVEEKEEFSNKSAKAELQAGDVDKSQLSPGSVAIDSALPGTTAIAGMLKNEMGIITPLIPKEYIDLLFTLSVTDPLLSQTIYDNQTLGNSGHTVRLEGAPDSVLEDAAEELSNLAVDIFPGGADAWFSVAFYQIYVAGALSHELVIEDDLSGVKNSKFVPVQSIRFRSSGENDGKFKPIQKHQGKEIELNPITYTYRPLIQWENHPYGIPPFFAAIEPVWIKRDVMGSIRGIAKKFGLLGLFNIFLDRPDRDIESNESEADYRARLETYLKDAKTKLEKDFNDGILIGFKGQHDFEHESVTGDARGMAEIYDKIDIEAHSGANTDPSLHGRDFSRTETQIRQIYQKTVRQIENVREIPTRSLEYAYALHLILRDFPEVTVSIDWEPIDSLDSLRDEQLFGSKIDNEQKLYDAGIISQDERARRLGFEEPDRATPRVASPGTVGDASEGENTSENSSAVFKLVSGRYKRVDVKKKSSTHLRLLSEYQKRESKRKSRSGQSTHT